MSHPPAPMSRPPLPPGPRSGAARSGRARAAVALALWAGFPLLGLVVTGGLLFVPWSELSTGSLEPFGVLSGLCALLVAWSMRPRLSAFVAPGPRITADAYPALWCVLEQLADEVGDRVPEEVYLLGHANAFVGSRRQGLRRIGTLGIGLPLLVDLDQSALRAVLAHEYGHRHAGDTRLGPWFHSAGQSIGATVERLRSDGGVLQMPFIAYGNLFVDLTRAISREQELAADRLSARLCGGSVAQAALQWTQTRGRAWDAYWRGDVLPLLRLGVQPPIVEGWRLYTRGDHVQRALEAMATADEAPTDPWDSHPPTTYRLAALDDCPDLPARPDDHAPAAELLGDPEQAFDVVIRSMLVDPDRPLRRLPWEDTAREVWLPLWRAELASGPSLPDFSPRALPALLADLDSVVKHTRSGVRVLSPEAERRAAVRALALTLAVALADAGCEPGVGAGMRLVLRRGAVEVAPLEVVQELKDGRVTPEAWARTCEALGV